MRWRDDTDIRPPGRQALHADRAELGMRQRRPLACRFNRRANFDMPPMTAPSAPVSL